MFRFVLSIATALTLIGCEVPSTEVLVLLDSNIGSDREMTLNVQVFQSVDASAMPSTFVRSRADGGLTLPATFGVRPSANSSGTVTMVLTVSVAAGHHGEPAALLRRSARFSMTPRTTTFLPLYLPLECGLPSTGCVSATGSACTVSLRCEEQGTTCGDRGSCISVDVNPGPLPSGNPTAYAFDASQVDATVRPDVPVVDVPVADVVCGQLNQACCTGAVCNNGTACVSGSCHCATGRVACNGACVVEDNMHCGSTCTSCSGSTPRCSNGACAACLPGQIACGGTCVTESNTMCGNACAVCAGGQQCVAGSCQCPVNQVFCGGQCRAQDSSNCGATCSTCTAGTPVCSSGTCSGCSAGQVPCGAGCNTEDDQHCGGSCVACTNGQVCVSGSCQCPAGQVPCAGVCVPEDPDHCGSSCTMCLGGQTCANSVCTGCPTGQVSCSGSCAVEDNGHCGASCVACPAETPVCSGGACVNCPPEQANCMGVCTDQDVHHCGPTCEKCFGTSLPFCEMDVCVCHDDTSCDPGSACINKTCVLCGDAGQPCCTSDVCNGTLTCTAEICN